jgi:hypothetical protein
MNDRNAFMISTLVDFSWDEACAHARNTQAGTHIFPSGPDRRITHDNRVSGINGRIFSCACSYGFHIESGDDATLFSVPEDHNF